MASVEIIDVRESFGEIEMLQALGLGEQDFSATRKAVEGKMAKVSS